MNLKLAERETIILFNEADSEASIYTYNERLKTQAAEYAERNPGKMSRYEVDSTGALHCALPKSELKILFKKPRSEKQQQAMLENLRKARESLHKPRSLGG